MNFWKSTKGRKALVIILTAIAMWPGQWIPFSAQWPFYEALRTTAGIIFAVIGAWITVLYPRGLERVFDRWKEGTAEDADRVRGLMQPLFYSTVVLSIVLLLGPFSQVARLLVEGPVWLRLARGSSFGLLVCLTLVQLWSLVLTLLPADQAQDELGHAQHKKDQAHRFQSLDRR